MARTTVFTAADDLLHDEVSAAGPLARESIALTAPIPEHDLLALVYVWREGGTKWGRFVFVAGPDPTRPLFVSFEADAKYTGDDLREFEVSGLRYRQPEALRTAEVEFCADGLDLRLQFEGFHAPFSWHDNASGCPSWFAHDRYEQTGLTTGQLTLGDRSLSFTGFGHRDHSWGTRDWRPLQHWKWMNAATPDGSTALHCLIAMAHGELLINGYLYRDGRLSPIARAQAHSEFDSAMFHRRVTGDFLDEAGRRMTLDARFAAGWSMPIQHLILNEAGMTATLDGRPAAGHVEMGWPATYLDLLAEQ